MVDLVGIEPTTFPAGRDALRLAALKELNEPRRQNVGPLIARSLMLLSFLQNFPAAFSSQAGTLKAGPLQAVLRFLPGAEDICFPRVEVNAPQLPHTHWNRALKRFSFEPFFLLLPTPAPVLALRYVLPKARIAWLP